MRAPSPSGMQRVSRGGTSAGARGGNTPPKWDGESVGIFVPYGGGGWSGQWGSDAGMLAGSLKWPLLSLRGFLCCRNYETRLGGGGRASVICPGSPSRGNAEGHGHPGAVPGVSSAPASPFLHGPSESIWLLQLGKSWKVGKKHFGSCKKLIWGMDEEEGQNQTENCAFVSPKVVGFGNSPPFAFDPGWFLHTEVLCDKKCQQAP